LLFVIKLPQMEVTNSLRSRKEGED